MKRSTPYEVLATLLALLGALFLAGCSDQKTHLKPITATSVVVVFGDSLTAGTGTLPDNAYPAVLGRELGCTVLNEGIPGQTSSQGLARLPELIERRKPTHVILCYGGNDMLQDVREDAIRSNLGEIVDRLRAAACEVVLIGVPKPKPGLPRAELYETLAKQYGIPCDNEIVREVLSHDRLKSDEIHPNAEGYKMIASAVAELIRESTP